MYHSSTNGLELTHYINDYCHLYIIPDRIRHWEFKILTIYLLINTYLLKFYS